VLVFLLMLRSSPPLRDPTASPPQEVRSRVVALGLTGLILASITVRGLFALRHEVARFFPDEYTYASLGRSISEGHYAIRGVTSHFPAFLEPLLTAPIWASFSTTTAFHAIQIENVTLVSLGCVPVYLLAHYLGLSRRYAFACAVYSVTIPTLLLASFNLSDPVAYPFALAAVTAGVRSLDRPTTRRQAMFLAFAGLATLARIQYLALPAAYVVAAMLIDRKRFLRTHWVILAPIAPAVLAILGMGTSRALGFYSYNPIFKLNHSLFHSVGHWFVLHLYLLTITSGVIIVPGAVAGLIGVRERAARAFAFMSTALLVLLFIQAASYSATATGRFRERYVFLLLPLVPIAFGLYLKRGRPFRPLVIAIALIVALALARLPLSAYAVPGLSDDSPFLYAVQYLQDKIGIDIASLVVALAATAAAGGAVAVAFRGYGRQAVALTIGVAVLASAGAIAFDHSGSSRTRRGLPRDLTWVDDASNRLVTAVMTPDGDVTALFDPLYWNRSIQREALLGNAHQTDVFTVQQLRVAKNGDLVGADPGDLLFDVQGTTSVLADAKVLAREPNFVLWSPNAAPRFRLLFEGRYSDDWLSATGRLRAWPLHPTAGTRVSFTLIVPRSRTKPIHMRIGRSRFIVRRGSPQNVECTNQTGPLDLRFSSRDSIADQSFRLLTLKLVDLRVTDLPSVRGGLAGSRCSVR
jgi:hypothetical protein